MLRSHWECRRVGLLNRDQESISHTWMGSPTCMRALIKNNGFPREAEELNSEFKARIHGTGVRRVPTSYCSARGPCYDRRERYLFFGRTTDKFIEVTSEWFIKPCRLLVLKAILNERTLTKPRSVQEKLGGLC
jgi:hypothetical protein